jgi:hypothetical protein
LITNVNKPNVKQVIGKVNVFKIGRTTALTRPKIIATKSKLTSASDDGNVDPSAKPSNPMPGTIQIAANSAIIVVTKRTNKRSMLPPSVVAAA